MITKEGGKKLVGTGFESRAECFFSTFSFAFYHRHTGNPMEEISRGGSNQVPTMKKTTSSSHACIHPPSWRGLNQEPPGSCDCTHGNLGPSFPGGGLTLPQVPRFLRYLPVRPIMSAQLSTHAHFNLTRRFIVPMSPTAIPTLHLAAKPDPTAKSHACLEPAQHDHRFGPRRYRI